MMDTMNKLDRLDKTLLYILEKAQEQGKDNLSKFELMKLVYLIEVNARQFIGESFTHTVTFVREKNGPISYDIYKSTEKLKELGLIEITEETNSEYGYPRHCHKLIKLPNLEFSDSETIFLNSILEDYIKLNIGKLKTVVYQTEPMVKIQEAEKPRHAILKGQRLKMEDIPLDENILEAIMQ